MLNPPIYRIGVRFIGGMSEEEILQQHEAEQREYERRNAELSILRTQQKLRTAQIEERQRWFDYKQGVPTRAYTDKELEQMFPKPEPALSFVEQPIGFFSDDSVVNNFGATSLFPDEKRRAWMAMLAQSPPPRRNRSATTAYQERYEARSH